MNACYCLKFCLIFCQTGDGIYWNTQIKSKSRKFMSMKLKLHIKECCRYTYIKFKLYIKKICFCLQQYSKKKEIGNHEKEDTSIDMTVASYPNGNYIVENPTGDPDNFHIIHINDYYSS